MVEAKMSGAPLEEGGLAVNQRSRAALPARWPGPGSRAVPAHSPRAGDTPPACWEMGDISDTWTAWLPSYNYSPAPGTTNTEQYSIL